MGRAGMKRSRTMRALFPFIANLVLLGRRYHPTCDFIARESSKEKELRMKVLVLGGTGTVGSQVVRELVSRGGVEVSVLTRDPQKTKGLPSGVRAIRGDLLDPATVRSV